MKTVRRFVVLGLLPFLLLPAHSASADPLVVPDRQIQAPRNSIGVLSIPKLKISAKVYVRVTMSVLDKGVGAWPGGPAFGSQGNIVLGGHRTSGKRPFYNIDKLVKGDIIALTSQGVTSNYAVVKTLIVKPTATWILNPSSDARVTLFSCHPKGSIAKRYVVQAKLIQ